MSKEMMKLQGETASISGLSRSKQALNLLSKNLYPESIRVWANYNNKNAVSINQDNILTDVKSILMMMKKRRETWVFALYIHLNHQTAISNTDDIIPNETLSKLVNILLGAIEYSISDNYFDDMLFISFTERLLSITLKIAINKKLANKKIRKQLDELIECSLFEEKHLEELSQMSMASIPTYYASNTIADNNTSTTKDKEKDKDKKKRGRTEAGGSSSSGSSGGYSSSYYTVLYSTISTILKECTSGASMTVDCRNRGRGGGSVNDNELEASRSIAHLLQIYRCASWTVTELILKRLYREPNSHSHSQNYRSSSNSSNSNDKHASRGGHMHSAASVRWKHYCRVIQFSLRLMTAIGAEAVTPSPLFASISLPEKYSKNHTRNSNTNITTNIDQDLSTENDGKKEYDNEEGDGQVQELELVREESLTSKRQRRKEPRNVKGTTTTTTTHSTSFDSNPNPMTSVTGAKTETKTETKTIPLATSQLRTRNALLCVLKSVLSDAGSLPTHNDQVRELIQRLGDVATDAMARLVSLSSSPSPPCNQSNGHSNNNGKSSISNGSGSGSGGNSGDTDVIVDIVSGHMETVCWLMDIDHRAVLGWENEDMSPLTRLIEALAIAAAATAAATRSTKTNTVVTATTVMEVIDRRVDVENLEYKWILALLYKIIEVHASLSRLNILIEEFLKYEDKYNASLEDPSIIRSCSSCSSPSSAITTNPLSYLLGHNRIQTLLMKSFGDLSPSQLEMCWQTFGGVDVHRERNMGMGRDRTKGGKGVCVGVVLTSLVLPLIGAVRNMWQLPVLHMSAVFTQAVEGLLANPKDGSSLLVATQLLRLASRAVAHFPYYPYENKEIIRKVDNRKVDNGDDNGGNGSASAEMSPTIVDKEVKILETVECQWQWNAFYRQSKILYDSINTAHMMMTNTNSQRTTSSDSSHSLFSETETGFPLLLELCVFYSNISVIAATDTSDTTSYLPSEDEYSVMITHLVQRISAGNIGNELNLFPILVRSAGLWDHNRDVDEDEDDDDDDVGIMEFEVEGRVALKPRHSKDTILGNIVHAWMTHISNLDSDDAYLKAMSAMLTDVMILSTSRYVIFTSMRTAVSRLLTTITIDIKSIVGKHTHNKIKSEDEQIKWMRSMNRRIDLILQLALSPRSSDIFGFNGHTVSDINLNAVEVDNIAVAVLQLVGVFCTMWRSSQSIDIYLLPVPSSLSESLFLSMDSCCRLTRQVILLRTARSKNNREINHNDNRNGNNNDFHSIASETLSVLLVVLITAPTLEYANALSLLLVDMLLLGRGELNNHHIEELDGNGDEIKVGNEKKLVLIRQIFEYVKSVDNSSPRLKTSPSVTDAVAVAAHCYNCKELFRIVCNAVCTASTDVLVDQKYKQQLLLLFEEFYDYFNINVTVTDSMTSSVRGNSYVRYYFLADVVRVLSCLGSETISTMNMPSVGNVENGEAWLYLLGVLCQSRHSHGQVISPSAATVLITQLMTVITTPFVLDKRVIDFSLHGVIAVLPVTMETLLGQRLIRFTKTLMASEDINNSSGKIDIIVCNLLLFANSLLHGKLQKDSIISIAIFHILDVCCEKLNMNAESKNFNILVEVLQYGIEKTKARSYRRRKEKHGNSNRKQDHEDVMSDADDSKSAWTKCSLSLLTRITDKLVLSMPHIRQGQRQRNGNGNGNGKVHSINNSVSDSDVNWILAVNRTIQLLGLTEQVLNLSSTELGPSVGVIGALLHQFLHILINAHRLVSVVNKSHISPGLRVGARTLAAVASCKELTKHCSQIAASMIDNLSGLEMSSEVKELLMPGLFVLFDRCQSRQKRQISCILDVQAGSLYRDLHEIYLSDFKFIAAIKHELIYPEL
eukprot:gene5166-10328_t